MQNIFEGKKVAILGFGLEGKDAYKFLRGKKAKITILDIREREELDLKDISKASEIITGAKYLDGGLERFDFVVRSPGVYRYLEEIIKAEKSGSVITSNIKIFFDNFPGKIIGVTGTKGKGTTSTLIYEILKAAGYNVFLGGNIGVPLLETLEKTDSESWVVAELSSFQLIDLTKSPHISVVLNITEDHLDWHKDREEYVQAKTSIVKFQEKTDFAVLNSDYGTSKNFEKLTKAKRYFFSRKNEVNGSYVKNGRIILGIDGQKIEIGDTKKLLLRGEHNWENVTAAVCASSLTGADAGIIRNTVFSFKGLEHRLELVTEYKGIKFYNDSFSTNPQTTIAAVKSFAEPMTIILGGFDKGLNYDEMALEMKNSGKVVNAILIGDIADKIDNSLKKANFTGNIFKMGKPQMKDMVELAFNNTSKGGVIIFSPASSSFDMFPNYKERGWQFKEAVKLLNSSGN